MAKHIVSLIDGTKVNAAYTSVSNSYSNVFELASLLQIRDKTESGESQVVFYRSGISSSPDSRSIYNLATGNTIMSQIVDQYTNICANFDFSNKHNPDKIYLFGFSRGSMAVRALASIISEFGLLSPKDIQHLPEVLYAWENCEGRAFLKNSIALTQVRIEFIGIFDSVMGGIESLPAFNPVRFSDHLFPALCKRGIHLIAIDEDRPHFRHKLWTGAKPEKEGSGHAHGASQQIGSRRARSFRQIWMPGIHSDVGGTGNPFLGNIALLSMIYFVRKLTMLSFDDQTVEDREHRVRVGIGQRRFRISGNYIEFPYSRKVTADPVLNQFYHPICEKMEACKYKIFRKKFRWFDRVFKTQFDSMDRDEILYKYFSHICR